MVGANSKEHFLLWLSSELADNDKPVESRRLAGMKLVDATAKEANLWVSMDREIKSEIKDRLLTTLGSSSALEARQCSSLVIAKVASIEIPLKQWPDLFQSLLRNMTTTQPAQVKQSTLETLCYVCQEISQSHEVLVNNEVNSVIRAVLRGTIPSEPSGVRLAATKALLNVLGFAQANFGYEMESCLIFRVVYRAAISQEVEIRLVAFQCLVSIASKYYQVLGGGKYMELFELTLKAINGDLPSVALQAIAFWSSISDVEMELQAHSNLIMYTLPHLIPILLESLLMKQGDEVDAAVLNILAKLLSHILKQLGHALDCPEIDDGREKQAKLQLSLCSLLQFLVHKLSGTDKTKHLVLQKSDAIMTLFFRVLACHQSSGEAMMATGSLACATGPAFEKYLPDLFNYLKVGLENFKECSITVGVVGDICRAIHVKILPFCDQIMSLLLQNLQSDALPTSVKPLIFSCIGDIALAIGGHFSERYLTPALQIIMQGAEAEVSSDEELMDYANQLRKSILKAYSGILQGCEDAKAEFMMPYLLQFINLDDAQNGRGRDGRSCRRIGQKTRQLLENLDVCGEAAKEMREYRG